MQEQNLFFNILTFDCPKQPVTFYFHEEEQDKFPRIHRSLFPKQIANIFPQVATNPTKEFISCSLAYVFLPDGTCLNELMIKEGFAKPYSRYYCEALADFQQINIFAKSNQKGLYQTVNDF